MEEAGKRMEPGGKNHHGQDLAGGPSMALAEWPLRAQASHMGLPMWAQSFSQLILCSLD